MIWDLPTDYLSTLLSNWLTTPELGRLDSATCNKNARTIFLNIIKSPNFVSEGDAVREIEDLNLLWHLRRSVRMRSMVRWVLIIFYYYHMGFDHIILLSYWFLIIFSYYINVFNVFFTGSYVIVPLVFYLGAVGDIEGGEVGAKRGDF
jgi:hypothetical protein